jgi:dnd system-associated protein 4
MTAPALDVRVRRPHEHEALIIELQSDAGFSTIRAVLLFAASLGFHVGRRVPFTSAGEPVRYDTLTKETFAEALIQMIAAVDVQDDPEILDQSRLPEQVKIFEEYVNGGLEYLQEQINVRSQPASVVVISLVTDALLESGGAEAASVEELLGGISWTRE